jgi:putative ABC transport system permease protein
MDAVDKIAPEVSAGRKQVIAQGNNTNTSITGVTAEYATVRNVTVGSGVFFNPDQERSLAKVAFIGPDVATDLFGEGSNPVGKKITNRHHRLHGYRRGRGAGRHQFRQLR